MGIIFGVDVGGTSIKMGMFSSDGALLEKWKITTRPGEVIFQDIADEIRKKVEEQKLTLADLQGVGIGVPGPVRDDGYAEMCVNIDLYKVNVSEKLSVLLGGVPVVTTNDANGAALGELWQGAGRGCQSLFMVTLGTGIGGGVVYRGRVINGLRGVAGEIGHIPIYPEETETCNCGGRGCLEQVASATGVVTQMKRRLQTSPEAEGSPLSRLGSFTAKDVVDAAKLGDKLALANLEFCMDYLGKMLAILGQIVDPQVFVIGGGLSHAGDFLLDLIRKYYKKHSIFAAAQAEVVQAQLGNDAGIFGAAKLILDK